MRTPPTLDEIDLGPEKRRIVWPAMMPIWGYFVIAGVWLALLIGGGAMIVFGARPGSNDFTLALILILVGVLLCLCEILLAGVAWYFSGQILFVFADGVCYERRGQQECYRWKDFEKIVEYEKTPGVYWLYFKNGRKVAVTQLEVDVKDWLAVRRHLDRKIPDKFVLEN